MNKENVQFLNYYFTYREHDVEKITSLWLSLIKVTVGLELLCG